MQKAFIAKRTYQKLLKKNVDAILNSIDLDIYCTPLEGIMAEYNFFFNCDNDVNACKDIYVPCEAYQSFLNGLEKIIPKTPKNLALIKQSEKCIKKINEIKMDEEEQRTRNSARFDEESKQLMEIATNHFQVIEKEKISLTNHYDQETECNVRLYNYFQYHSQINFQAIATGLNEFFNLKLKAVNPFEIDKRDKRLFRQFSDLIHVIDRLNIELSNQ